MNEIIKIVLERNKERKLLTSDDVKKICFIILKKNNYDFVKRVNVVPFNPNNASCAAVYYDKDIFFFYKQLIDILQNNFEEFTESYEIDGANADIYNYLYLNIIFHELAHVRQHAVVFGSHNNIEKKIFSMFLEVSKNRDFYNDNYRNILTEVNADNVSFNMTNSIYRKFPKNFLTQNDWCAYQSYFLKHLFYENYELIEKRDKVLSPAERVIDEFDEEILFYLDTNLSECINLIYDTDKLTLYKKLMLGLPISYNEYAYCNLIGDRLHNIEEINALKRLQKKI